MGEDDSGKKGKDCQGTCIKDTWTKSKEGRIMGGRWEWLGRGNDAGKRRQLYFNNNNYNNKKNMVFNMPAPT